MLWNRMGNRDIKNCVGMRHAEVIITCNSKLCADN